MRFLICLLLGLVFLTTPLETVGAETVDTDGDGLTDLQEQTIYHTDPTKNDTDGDGFSDGVEVSTDFSPLIGDKIKMIDVDTDHDGLNDRWETLLGTDLTNKDSDGDGHLDGEEVATSYDPLSSSTIKLTKHIDVSIADQSLTYSFNGTNLETFKISSGTKYYPTPKGNFTVQKKVPVVNYSGPTYSYPKTKWNLLFLRNKYGYYIHGAYWHNKFGQPMSHGCVNVSYANMERLYKWADTETGITIH